MLSGATVISVPTQQPTIQAGIDAASAGDTVRVSPGHYMENIAIDKPLRLESTSLRQTIIEGNGTGDVIRITSNGVTVAWFQIRGIGSESVLDGEWDAGVHIYWSDSCLVHNCDFLWGAAGVAVGCSQYNTIRNCHFSANQAGVYLYEAYVESEPSVRDNVGNRILHNQFCSADDYGVRFAHGGWVHHVSNEVRGNLFSKSHIGMGMIMSETNEISYNLFSGNEWTGIDLMMCKCGGEGNMIHHNVFVKNGETMQASDWGGGPDFWYDQNHNEGNYWSDYDGEDADGDGIGDTPYVIDVYDNVTDPYPLMGIADSDGDGVMDSVDICSDASNSEQEGSDGDMVGVSCCCGVYTGGFTGNVDCDYYGKRSLTDITRLIDRVYLTHEPLCCEANANVDGDAEGKINLSDVTRLIDNIYLSRAQTAVCQ